MSGGELTCNFTEGWKKQCGNWLLKTDRLLSFSSQQPLAVSCWFFSRCCLAFCLLSCSLMAAHLHQALQKLFYTQLQQASTRRATQLSLWSSALPLLILAWRRKPQRRPACLHASFTPSSDLLPVYSKIKSKPVSRKDGFCTSKNVMCVVCQRNTIGIYNLVNGRKKINSSSINPSQLSVDCFKLFLAYRLY